MFGGLGTWEILLVFLVVLLKLGIVGIVVWAAVLIIGDHRSSDRTTQPISESNP
jgi:hypothetical protein